MRTAPRWCCAGKWVLETLLGAPPPAPPPNVPPLKESDRSKPTSLARSDGATPGQSGVRDVPHADGSVWGLRWSISMRSGSGGRRTVACPSMPPFRGTASPCAARRSFGRRCSHGDDFVRTVTEKMLTYALGRGVEYYDAPVVRQLVRDLEAGRLPLVGAGPGNRPQRAVSDAARFGRRGDSEAWRPLQKRR